MRQSEAQSVYEYVGLLKRFQKGHGKGGEPAIITQWAGVEVCRAIRAAA